jgi:hypothetical protein
MSLTFSEQKCLKKEFFKTRREARKSARIIGSGNMARRCGSIPVRNCIRLSPDKID